MITGNKRWAITDKMFLSLFFTRAIIELSLRGAGFIDGLVIGRYLGASDLAAEGISRPIFSILGIMSGMISVGMQAKCSQEIGRGNRNKCSHFFSAAVYSGMVFAVIITVLMIFYTKPLAKLLGASGNAADLLDKSAAYLMGIGTGVPALMMTSVLSPAIQLESGRKTVQTGALAGLAVNIVFDPLVVKLGMGIFGIGLVTAAGSYVNLIYQCTHFLKKDRIMWLIKPEISVKEYFKMLGNGSESALRRIAGTLCMVILNGIIISYGGTMAMSAFSVQNNYASLLTVFTEGVCSSVSLLVSFYYGEINEEGIQEVDYVKDRIIIFFTATAGLLLFVFSKPVAGFYVPGNMDILPMASFAVKMLAIQIPFQVYVTCRIKYLQSVHREKNMNVLIWTSKLIFLILSAFVSGKIFGVYGILASYTISDIISALSVLIFYQIKHHKLLITRKELLNLPEEFQLYPGDIISLDIRDIEDVSLASEQIMLLCRGHKFNKKISYYGSLAFEELASNIIQYGFPENKSGTPVIDLRVVITSNELVLRIQDNCPQYDVTRYFSDVNKEDADITKNIGVRIVSRIASDISYMHIFETNDIIIRLKNTY